MRRTAAPVLVAVLALVGCAAMPEPSPTSSSSPTSFTSTETQATFTGDGVWQGRKVG